MNALSGIEEVISQTDSHVHNSYTQLVVHHHILSDLEFYNLYNNHKKLMRFNPKLQTIALLEPVISFIPHKYVEFQELKGFAIKRLHHDSGSRPLEAIVSPAYKEMVFRLYPNIKSLYDSTIKEGFTSESDFWLHLTLEFDDHAKSSYITEFTASGASGSHKAAILPGANFMDDSSKTMSHILNLIKRAFSNKHERFRNVFDINNVHINLLKVVGNMTSFGPSTLPQNPVDSSQKDANGTETEEAVGFRCGINDLLYDTRSGSVVDLLAVMDDSDKLQGNITRLQPQSSSGIGDDLHDCYRSASNFVLMRSIQAYNLFLMKDLGHDDILNASILTYQDMMNTCILDTCSSEPPLKRVSSGPRLEATRSRRNTVPEELSAEEITSKNEALRTLLTTRYSKNGTGDTLSKELVSMCFTNKSNDKVFPYQTIQTGVQDRPQSQGNDVTPGRDAVYVKNFQWLYDFSRYTMAVLFSDEFRELRNNKETFKQKLNRLYRQLDYLEKNLTAQSPDSILFCFENRVKKILKLTEDSLAT